MVRFLVPLTLSAVLIPALASPEPARLTVLPTGTAQVEEQLAVPAGAAAPLAIPRPASLEPESVVATLGLQGAPLEIRLEPPRDDLSSWIRLCIGRTVQISPPAPGEGGETVDKQGTLQVLDESNRLGLVAFRDGQVAPIPWTRIQCPAAPDARWRIVVMLPSRPAPATLNLRYRLGGFSWQARHRLDINPEATTGLFAPQALVTLPPGLDFDQAELRLVEGSVPREAAPRPSYGAEKRMMVVAAAPEPPPTEESQVLDLMVFDVPGIRSLVGPANLSLPLRSPKEVPIEEILVLDAQRHPSSDFNTDPIPPVRHLRFKVADLPLPAGVFEVGVRGADGHWSLLGEVTSHRVAVGETADLALGDVREFVARLTRPAFLPAVGHWQREAEFELEATNRRPAPVRLEFRFNFFGPYELVQSQPNPTRREGSWLSWTLNLAPKEGKATVRFRGRYEPRREH